MDSKEKTVPRRMLVFGASGHIGGPAADHVRRNSPATTLRLATSAPAKIDQLRRQQPDAECVHADYLDPPTLAAAFDGVDACLVITPDFLDEEQAMRNVVRAATDAGTVRHLVRVTGDPIGVRREEDVPLDLRRWGGGTAVQHTIARRVLEDSELPVTYMNVASYLMDNFLRTFSVPLRTEQTLALPYDHRMSFVDAGDVGEACAAVLLSDDHRHLGKTYNLDSGSDVLLFSEAAALLSDVIGVPVRYDGSPETFTRLNGEAINSWVGRPDGVDYYLRYFEWEREMSTLWRRTDILEYLLGRPGTTLRAWFAGHATELTAMLAG